MCTFVCVREPNPGLWVSLKPGLRFCSLWLWGWLWLGWSLVLGGQMTIEENVNWVFVLSTCGTVPEETETPPWCGPVTLGWWTWRAGLEPGGASGACARAQTHTHTHTDGLPTSHWYITYTLLVTLWIWYFSAQIQYQQLRNISRYLKKKKNKHKKLKRSIINPTVEPN